MIVYFLKSTLVVLFLLKNGWATPVLEYDKASKYEEYIVEHEISLIDARNSVLNTSLQQMLPSPGCQKCSLEEKRYCLGIDLINDHCCCDRRHHELFPFIPHTCYFGDQLCSPIAGTCDNYYKLSICCCKKYAFLKWKEKSSCASLLVSKTLLCISLYIVSNFT
ncbi:unnamed protein product [Acanthoscelides obtectus]|uniref:CCC domain-containing protein n=1 Tax=Acanthoscelides obtectus TaxID=200917 RepID=A0A9P0PK60_ACAOB|nr:unnamed protein product [Acanthoscelides obtectus]CAK1659824.1 hypothetical protein AOBTE_LOCUS21694 [Acanthoscelides obtectus]